MTLEIIQLPLGMTMTNAFLVGEVESKQAVVIDPGFEGEKIAAQAESRDWQINAIWLTHAHFDHIGGVGSLIAALGRPLDIAMHPEDEPLWQARGGAGLFGIEGVDPGPKPTITLAHGQNLALGAHTFEVRHTPGHTPGHVVFYAVGQATLFCGDVIFRNSIGRTDLPGGDFNTLITSIRTQVFTLPDDTLLLNGHGPETTVGYEKIHNPFLQ